MSKTPSHLRLYPASSPAAENSFALLWSAPVNPGVGTALGHLRIERTADVLRGGAEALGCSAAGAYLLDHDTTQLKLRASWGLPPGRLAADARPLDEATADLEAICGHAVVMENQDMLQAWRCPEPDFSAALCVPISSPTTLLGTLWMLADEPREFSDRETNLAEIIAGRIASDLQCEALLDEAILATDLRRQLLAAEQSQQNSLPQIAPLADAWEVAGDSWQAGPLGGAFHDWFALDDNTLALVAGSATGRGVEAALAARELRATVRAHAACVHDASSLMQRVDESVARGSAGDRRDHLCYALLDADMGRIRYAAAGTMGIMVVGPGGWQSLSQPLSQTTAELGAPSVAAREQHIRVLAPGESLVVYNRAVLEGSSPERSIGESTLAEWLLEEGACTAATKIERLRQRLDRIDSGPASADRTLLIARYRG